MTDQEEPLFVGPSEGTASRGVSGAPTLIKLGTEQTAGLVAVFEQATPAGSGPPMHIHHECAEMLYVLEGTYRFEVGDRLVEAERGTLVFVPRGVAHTYVNPGPQRAKLLFWCVPAARMAAYIEALGELPPGDDYELVQRIAQEHGVEIVSEGTEA